MKKALSFLCLLATVVAANADRDLGPRDSRVIASSDGAYFLLVTPVSEKMQNWLWTVDSVGHDGVFKESWNHDGIYSREVFLANDGIHIVCMESWPNGATNKDDVLIAVYAQGTLVKAYRVVDLVKDLSAIQRSISHYRWLAEKTFVHSIEDALYFTTIDDRKYELDMVTGKLTRISE